MPLPRIGNPRVIVCEGKSDVAFLTALLKARHITRYDVICPWDLGRKLEGEDAIIQVLNMLPTQRSFSSISNIVLVTDSDNDPNLKFGKFQEVLRSTAVFGSPPNRFPVPTMPYEIARSPGTPATSIAVLPSENETGAMEGLCWEAGKAGRPALAACIDSFAECSGATAWSPQMLAKFHLRCLITGVASRNPDLPTTYLWEEIPDLVPLDAAEFDSLAAYLDGVA